MKKKLTKKQVKAGKRLEAKLKKEMNKEEYLRLLAAQEKVSSSGRLLAEDAAEEDKVKVVVENTLKVLEFMKLDKAS